MAEQEAQVCNNKQSDADFTTACNLEDSGTASASDLPIITLNADDFRDDNENEDQDSGVRQITTAGGHRTSDSNILTDRDGDEKCESECISVKAEVDSDCLDEGIVAIEPVSSDDEEEEGEKKGNGGSLPEKSIDILQSMSKSSQADENNRVPLLCGNSSSIDRMHSECEIAGNIDKAATVRTAEYFKQVEPHTHPLPTSTDGSGSMEVENTTDNLQSTSAVCSSQSCASLEDDFRCKVHFETLEGSVIVSSDVAILPTKSTSPSRNRTSHSTAVLQDNDSCDVACVSSCSDTHNATVSIISADDETGNEAHKVAKNNLPVRSEPGDTDNNHDDALTESRHSETGNLGEKVDVSENVGGKIRTSKSLGKSSLSLVSKAANRHRCKQAEKSKEMSASVRKEEIISTTVRKEGKKKVRITVIKGDWRTPKNVNKEREGERKKKDKQKGKKKKKKEKKKKRKERIVNEKQAEHDVDSIGLDLQLDNIKLEPVSDFEDHIGKTPSVMKPPSSSSEAAAAASAGKTAKNTRQPRIFLAADIAQELMPEDNDAGDVESPPKLLPSRSQPPRASRQRKRKAVTLSDLDEDGDVGDDDGGAGNKASAVPTALFRNAYIKKEPKDDDQQTDGASQGGEPSSEDRSAVPRFVTVFRLGEAWESGRVGARGRYKTNQIGAEF
jgi:hypothetical protein